MEKMTKIEKAIKVLFAKKLKNDPNRAQTTGEKYSHYEYIFVNAVKMVNEAIFIAIVDISDETEYPTDSYRSCYSKLFLLKISKNKISSSSLLEELEYEYSRSGFCPVDNYFENKRMKEIIGVLPTEIKIKMEDESIKKVKWKNLLS